MKQEDFLKKVEAILNTRIGNIAAGSILKNNLSKMNKAVASLDESDMQILIESIIESVRLFESNDESELIKEDLKDLLKKFD